MHLKNFSLYRPADNYMLTPAYDLLSTSIVMPDDDEELALTLNGKKKRINRSDFETAMLDSGMDEKAIEKLFKKFAKTLPKWYALIEESFLPKDMIVAYREKLNTMSARLGLL